MANFIPYFHFENPDKKLSAKWCMEVINYCYYNYNNVNLLHNKNVDLIEQYFTGDIDMAPYKKMFTSLRKAMRTNADLTDIDKTGLSWEPLALLPQKMNSAIATLQRAPAETICEAQDALAMKKKKHDLEFLKNKELIEADLEDIAAQLQIDKIDLGATKNGATKYSEAPMGLDLNDADEENIFSQLLYSLDVEKANEKALDQIYHLKKASRVRYLETVDQFKYGVSSHMSSPSSITGLPDLEYIFPGDVDLPPSLFPDFSDNTHRIINRSITVMELFNYFSDEIGSKEDLQEIINGDNGYCSENKRPLVDESQWDTFRVNLKLVEVKSVDWVGVASKKKFRRDIKYFTRDEKKVSYKIWGQNTYSFWWLVNTDYVFGIKRLGFSRREKGQESYQNFSTNIYRSQRKSATEVSIGLNKQAQTAFIKLEYALIKSLPAGKYIDLRFLRNALSGLKEETKEWTQMDLLTLAWEHNLVVGDTEGMEGRNDGQMKPFIDIPGGVKTEIEGYWSTILRINQIIGNITGINEPLTGTAAEDLVGLQESRINSALNAIYYVTDAIQYQYQQLFNLWAYELSAAIKAGGKTKEAVIGMIGIQDTELLNGLEQSPLHNLTIKLTIGQRDFEKSAYLNQLNFLKQKGVISTADEYMLSAIKNPKERMAYLAVKEKRFMKQADKERQQQFEQSQQLIQQQGQNEMAKAQAEGAEKLKQTYAKGEVEAKLLQLTNQLGLTRDQFLSLSKQILQRDRNKDQKDKLLSGIREKKTLENQTSL